MCLRDADTGRFANADDLFFVLLHELSHIANEKYGHGPEFWDEFRTVLELANKTGDLGYASYETRPITVCGKTITSNPLTCVVEGACPSALPAALPAAALPAP